MCNAAAGAVTLKSSKKDHSCVRWRTDDLGRWGDGSRAGRTAAYARRCGSEGQVAAIQKSFADCVCDAQIPPAIAVVDGDGRHIDLVVIFLHELDVGRNWDVGWLRSAQNLVDNLGGALPSVHPVRSIGHQTARFDVLSGIVNGRQPRADGQRVDASAV